MSSLSDINSFLSGPSSKPLRRNVPKVQPAALKSSSTEKVKKTANEDLRTLIKSSQKPAARISTPETNKTLACDEEWTESVFIRGTFVVENTFRPNRTASACKATSWELKKIVKVSQVFPFADP